MYNIVHTLCTQVYDFHRHMNMCFLVPWIGYHMLPARLEITWAEIHHSFGKPTGWILNVPTMSFAIGRYKPARIRQTCLKGCRGSKKNPRRQWFHRWISPGRWQFAHLCRDRRACERLCGKHGTSKRFCSDLRTVWKRMEKDLPKPYFP